MKINYLFLIILSFCLSACSFMKSDYTEKAVMINQFRGSMPPNLVEQEIKVDKNKYNALVGQQTGLNSARLVEIYQRGRISDQIKEYRIMDVKHGSIYQMLGLKSKDMIIAADGYIIPTPQAFWNYLGLIAQLGAGNIEIMRGQQPMLLRINFVE